MNLKKIMCSYKIYDSSLSEVKQVLLSGVNNEFIENNTTSNGDDVRRVINSIKEGYPEGVFEGTLEDFGKAFGIEGTYKGAEKTLGLINTTDKDFIILKVRMPARVKGVYHMILDSHSSYAIRLIAQNALGARYVKVLTVDPKTFTPYKGDWYMDVQTYKSNIETETKELTIPEEVSTAKEVEAIVNETKYAGAAFVERNKLVVISKAVEKALRKAGWSKSGEYEYEDEHGTYRYAPTYTKNLK